MLKGPFAAGFLAVHLVLCTACSSSDNPEPAAQGGSGGDSSDAATSAGGKGTGGGTAGAGGASSTGGGSNGGASSNGGGPDDPSFGIFFTVGSIGVALTEAKVAGHEPSSATVQASLGTASMTLSMTASGAIGPGTFDCASGTASVIYRQAGTSFTADQNNESCTITATSIAAAAGEITEGTFQARVVETPWLALPGDVAGPIQDPDGVGDSVRRLPTISATGAASFANLQSTSCRYRC